MTKSDVVKHVASRAAIPRKTAEAAIDSFLEVIQDMLSLGQDVQLSGFGKFSVKVRPPAKIKHPTTGKLIDVNSGLKVHFKPSLSLKRMAGEKVTTEKQTGCQHV